MLSILISCFGVLAGLVKLSGLRQARHVVVFVALGMGQIHLAVLGLILLLFSENGYVLPRHLPRAELTTLALVFMAVVGVTLLSTLSARSVSELLQLLIYGVLFLQFSIYLRNKRCLEILLEAMVTAALIVALTGITRMLIGASEPPHIYLDRGGNEGSVFLLLAGVIPAVTLFVQKRRTRYLLFVLLMLSAQVLATSRANIALTVLILGIGLYFPIRSLSLRMLLIVAVGAVIAGSVTSIQSVYENQSNESFLERIALYQAGWALWRERPSTGWGWGSTSDLAPATSLTEQTYPHFHSTYVQLLVELGFLGVVAVAAWAGGSLLLIFLCLRGKFPPAAATYVCAASAALLVSGFFSALLFGADRAVQVVLVLAIIRALLKERQEREKALAFIVTGTRSAIR
jgi:O-antigen ligase